MREMAVRAREAARTLATLNGEARARALIEIAAPEFRDGLREAWARR